MLADLVPSNVQFGSLGSDVHLPATSKYRLIDFIAEELPRWRDHADRPKGTSAETDLSEHLCDYLTGAARKSGHFDCYQFRTETADESTKGRKIDLAVKPCGVSIWIEGRRYTQFEAIMPIECKRLPTPSTTGRDQREYVVVETGTTGGIQRFKFGHHGASHELATMIGYIQEHNGSFWHRQVTAWIKQLAGKKDGWSSSDHLAKVAMDSASRVSRLKSLHSRKGKKPIELQHIWIGLS